MNRLDQATEIIELAQNLGVGGVTPAENILKYCQRKIDGWVESIGGVSSIDELEALVARKLQMVFEEVNSDDDWERLKDHYARGMKEFVFGGIRKEFEDDNHLTYGALVQRAHAFETDLNRFVAIIDCRGNKQARRFFTRWHEIAHRLTTHADLLEPVYRSEQDPIERMMDEIAAHVGFYEPLFTPAHQEARAGHSHLKFAVVESIIEKAFPTASFQSTLFACTRRSDHPVLYLEATLAHKKEAKRKLQTRSLFNDDPPPGELRAVKVIANRAASRQRFNIPQHMQVPASSVIRKLFDSEIQTVHSEEEDLQHWESRGKSLDGCPVLVEGRRISDRVIAIVQPIESRASVLSKDSVQ